jgi:hypothetical protein
MAAWKENLSLSDDSVDTPQSAPSASLLAEEDSPNEKWYSLGSG